MDATRRVIWGMVILLVLWVITYAIASAPSVRTPWTTAPTAAAPAIDLADIAYNVAGTRYVLNNGVAAVAEPDSSGQDVLRLYQATRGNLGGNNGQDAAVILIQSTSGTGLFYYLAAALTDGTTIPAVLLGDRIETDGVAIQNGTIVVHYKDRAADQPFSTPPSMSKVAIYRVVNGALVQK